MYTSLINFDINFGIDLSTMTLAQHALVLQEVPFGSVLLWLFSIKHCSPALYRCVQQLLIMVFSSGVGLLNFVYRLTNQEQNLGGDLKSSSGCQSQSQLNIQNAHTITITIRIIFFMALCMKSETLFFLIYMYSKMVFVFLA